MKQAKIVFQIDESGRVGVNVQGNFTKAELVFAMECLKTKYCSPQQDFSIMKGLNFDERLGK